MHTSDEKIYHPHWLYILQYSFDLLCLQVCSCKLTHSPYIIHPSHSFSNASPAHHIPFTNTFRFPNSFHTNTHCCAYPSQTPTALHFFLLIAVITIQKQKVTDMSINNTDRSYWQYNVFPPLHTRMHLARHLVIFSNHTYKSTCYNAWLIHHLTTTLRT